jgi:hypothetical protein
LEHFKHIPAVALLASRVGVFLLLRLEVSNIHVLAAATADTTPLYIWPDDVIIVRPA